MLSEDYEEKSRPFVCNLKECYCRTLMLYYYLSEYYAYIKLIQIRGDRNEEKKSYLSMIFLQIPVNVKN